MFAKRLLVQSRVALIVSYILQATEAAPEHLRPFFDQLGARAKEAFMTGAEILIEQGKAEGKAELLLRLLRLKHGELPETVSNRLRGAANDDLDRWAERVMTAPTLDEVFDGR